MEQSSDGEIPRQADDEHLVCTVGAIRHAIQGLADDVEITFGYTLNAVPIHFSRFKTRGPKLLQIELVCDDTYEDSSDPAD